MIKTIKERSLVSALLISSLAFVLAGAIWSFLALHSSQGPFILHFNEKDGITQIGSLSEVLNIALGGLLLVLVNSVLALNLDGRDPFWGKIMAAATLLFGILIFITLTAIISVN